MHKAFSRLGANCVLLDLKAMMKVTESGKNKGKLCYSCPDCNFWEWCRGPNSNRRGHEAAMIHENVEVEQ